MISRMGPSDTKLAELEVSMLIQDGTIKDNIKEGHRMIQSVN